MSLLLLPGVHARENLQSVVLEVCTLLTFLLLALAEEQVGTGGGRDRRGRGGGWSVAVERERSVGLWGGKLEWVHDSPRHVWHIRLLHVGHSGGVGEACNTVFLQKAEESW